MRRVYFEEEERIHAALEMIDKEKGKAKILGTTMFINPKTYWILSVYDDKAEITALMVGGIAYKNL